MRTLIIGTRGSRLALRQVEIVSDLLRAQDTGADLEVREIKTQGDRSTAPLSEIGGLGVFTKAIEDALLAGTIDIAVHSLKDLPAGMSPGLALGAIPQRGDVRDALITREKHALSDLPTGARIGTGAGRRAVQLLALRSDVSPVEIRGNVDTRIAKVERGEYDAIVVAMAGLERLGLADAPAHVFSIDEMLPAVGQAALGVQVRVNDEEAQDFVARIDHRQTRAAVEAERAYLRKLGGGCRLPVAAHGSIEGERLTLRVLIASEERLFRGEDEGDVGDAEIIGERLAERLLAEGAERFIQSDMGSFA